MNKMNNRTNRDMKQYEQQPIKQTHTWRMNQSGQKNLWKMNQSKKGIPQERNQSDKRTA